MAWTTPKTWASGYVVLAADLNTHLRDNLNVTAPAIMTTAGDIIYASGANTPARLAKSTTSTQYLANTERATLPPGMRSHSTPESAARCWSQCWRGIGSRSLTWQASREC